MSRPLSAAEQRARAEAAWLDSRVAVERERVDAGDLPDDRLVDLLRAVEHGAIRHPEIPGAAGYIHLGADRLREVKALAARAIDRRGGTFRALGFDWVSAGGTVKARMPAGGAP